MSLAAHRRTATRTIVLDRSLEALPLFRLSDSADDSAVTYAPESGGRWRVLPTPGDRVPGTFDQDVYVELLRRYHEANCPEDGVLTFTLHAFLRSIGRRVDGRTYEQLRARSVAWSARPSSRPASTTRPPAPRVSRVASRFSARSRSNVVATATVSSSPCSRLSPRPSQATRASRSPP